ncbi:MAG TPA: hypothetical protein PK109_02135 [Candidatus Paceibacterota bacterium]|nr:hypothetical protein [Candidatus Paceibacterota bacterium]
MINGPEKAPRRKFTPVDEVEEKKMSRRTLLAGLGLAGVTAAGVTRVMTSRISTEPLAEAAETIENIIESIPGVSSERESIPEGPYDTGPLAGRTLGNLFAMYLGLPDPSVVPERLSANFPQILSDLWRKKREYVMRHKPEWIDNTRRAEHRFLEEYRAWREGERDRGPKDLNEFNRSLQPVVHDIHAAVNFSRLNELAPFRRLSEEDTDLVKRLAGNISSKTLIAYGITELMPSVNDSALNVDMTEFLIKNAGAPFLAAPPAIHDPYVSAGLYQFTSHAVYAGEEGRRGASLINQLVTERDQRIPDSVIGLQTIEQQTRAAYLFAVENLARLIVTIRAGLDRNKRDERLRTLRDHADTLDIGTLQFIASAHHNPSQARRGFIKWLDKGLDGEHSIHCDSRIKDYIIKTNGIYNELSRRVRS